MPGAQRAVPLALLFVLTALAGCTSPEPGEQTLLQESIEVGERLYSWGSEDFHSDADIGQPRTIRYHMDVPGDMSDIGVRFAGRLEWTNISSAVLTITDPAGNDVLVLNATEGNEDSVGEIHQFWTFNEVIPAHAGRWTFAMRGEGNIGQVDFQMHGIERRDTVTQRGFTVADAGREVTVRVFLNGWGDTPDVFLDTPNGTTRPVPVNQYGEEATLSFDPSPGAYRVRANTTGWGGHIAFQVKQAA